MRLPILLLASLFLSSAALAQTPGSCDLGTAETDLNVGDVAARLFNTGSLFYGGSTTNGLGYIVPKGVAPPLFASGLWVGGFIDGDLRVAGSTYHDFEFWPGPLNKDGTLPDPDDCSAFDRIWNVSVFDLQQYDDTGIATADLAEWPVDLGAPVVDGDGIEGNYDLAAGDRPLVYGHQTAFWVMNDVGNVHQNSLTEPIGLEVRVTAFTSGELALDRYTFYRYELVNRNSQPFEDAIVTLFSDPDLGDAADDFVGSDSTRSMAFVYNENNDDSVYGTPPPAVGYDFLTDGSASRYIINSLAYPLSDPVNGEEMYNVMQGLWVDGTPFTEGGGGYQTDGNVVTWAFPGDPETDQFWSEVNTDGEGQSNTGGDRRHVLSSVPFTLAPGEARTVDLAILYARGSDHLNSVTQLKTVSDLVQARYDGDELFVPGPAPPAPGFLATPSLLAPANGATFVDTGVPLSWTAVPEAESYRVEVASDADFIEREVYYTAEPNLTFVGDPNEVTDYAWRVQAAARGLLTSFYSEVRSFTFYRYQADNYNGGIGIIEVANPDADVCPDADDPGCAEGYPGNTVWLDPNATGDYVLTNSDNQFFDLLRDVNTVEGDNFEMRFTDTCASAGACLGVYSSILPDGTDLITSVPFELWNAGAEDDEDDDVRMIPLLRAPDGFEPDAQWADTFPAEQEVIAGDDTLMLSVTHRVLGTMPDRENGYALFEAAANGFGGPGATYDPESDGDTQIDPGPDGQDCRSQSYYVDFCYRGGSTRFVAPLGGLDGLQLADLAGDGTTPDAGTVIRFDVNERLLTDAEYETPTQPTSFALGAVYPNPLRASATVPFEVSEASRVRLSVYDVLGREVAVLADGERAAGTHRAALDGSQFASGVYLVVLEARGQRQARKVMVLR